MLTPVFSISQTSRHVVFRLRLPYVKVSSAEIFVEGKTFKFFLHPYFLSLVLENEMQSDAIESAVYDHNTYYLTVKVLKKTEGEHFANLEMLTALRQPEKKGGPGQKWKPGIQVLASAEGPAEQVERDGETEVAELAREVGGLQVGGLTYGFNNGFSDVFKTYEAG